jgi:hypothetical protein
LLLIFSRSARPNGGAIVRISCCACPNEDIGAMPGMK